MVNLTDKGLSAPTLGIALDDPGFAMSLMVGGWERDPANGGGGFEILSELSAFQVWATLVPGGANGVNLLGGGQSVFALTAESGISFGYLVAPIPLPAPLLMLVAGLGSLWVVRRRRAEG